jgi:hypothetical protein
MFQFDRRAYSFTPVTGSQGHTSRAKKPRQGTSPVPGCTLVAPSRRIENTIIWVFYETDAIKGIIEPSGNISDHNLFGNK